MIKSYDEDIQSKEKSTESGIPYTMDSEKPSLLTLFKNVEYLFFLLIILTNGFCRFFMSFFLGVYLQDGVKMTSIESSVSAIMGLFLEIFMFFHAKKLIDKLGVYWMLVLGQLAMTMRLWGYYLLPANRSYLILFYLVELLKGVNMGFIQPTAVKLSDQYALPGGKTAAQGVFNSVFTGLGGFTAGIFAQLFMQPNQTNFEELMLTVSIISTAGLILFFLKYLLIDRVISIPFIKSK